MATLTQHDRVKEIAANFEQVRQAMGKASARSRLATKVQAFHQLTLKAC